MTFGPGSTYGDGGQSATTAYYVLTWLGIVVTILVLIGWIVYENRRLITYAATRARGGTEEAASARRRRSGVEAMNGKQIEFPEKQTHVKGFEYGMIVFSIICIIVVLIVVFATDIGVEFRPTV